ncbi:MAG: septation regulator SpoVG [Candidatus Muiribacteriota bacterium]
MEITDVRIRKVNGDGKLKAYVSITFDDIFVIHDLKIIEGKKGPFVAMPSKKMSNGEFKDTAHPLVTEVRENIQNTVLEKFNEICNNDTQENFVEADA